MVLPAARPERWFLRLQSPIIGGTTSGTTANDTAVVGASGIASLYTNGANVELDANSSITINGVIDTRAYANDQTAPVTLVSSRPATSPPAIPLDHAGRAHHHHRHRRLTPTPTAPGRYGCAVTLTASTTNNIAIGYATADSEITINGMITGASITAQATACASPSMR